MNKEPALFRGDIGRRPRAEDKAHRPRAAIAAGRRAPWVLGDAGASRAGPARRAEPAPWLWRDARWRSEALESRGEGHGPERRRVRSRSGPRRSGVGQREARGPAQLVERAPEQLA